jgi:membrane fusion protein (multidrug efflux system)
MIKRMIIMLIGLAVVFGGVFGWHAFVSSMIAESLASRQPPPVTVSAVHAASTAFRSEYQAVGTLAAVQGVDVSAEVAGRVTKIAFTSGADVKKGDLLVQLDDAPDRARLQGLKAQVEYAQSQVKRDEILVKRHAVPASQYDLDLSNLKNARAQVANVEALIAQKAIHAPFAGRLGIRLIDLGQYVSAGMPTVTLQALDPIYANFSLPQQDLSDLAVGMPVEVTVDAYRGVVFKGEITTISPKVDETTRNVQIQATLQNPEKRLRPGMFVTVHAILPSQENVVTVPSTAITYNPYGDIAYVVRQATPANSGGGMTAHSVVVTTGAQRGNQVVIEKGLKVGDLVVTAGQMKLHDGAAVRIDNSVPPSSNPTPRPPNS